MLLRSRGALGILVVEALAPEPVERRGLGDLQVLSTSTMLTGRSLLSLLGRGVSVAGGKVHKHQLS